MLLVDVINAPTLRPSRTELFICLGFVASFPSVGLARLVLGKSLNSIVFNQVLFVLSTDLCWFVPLCSASYLLLFSRRFERVHSVGPGRARTALYSLSIRSINVAAVNDFPRGRTGPYGRQRVSAGVRPVKHFTARTD